MKNFIKIILISTIALGLLYFKGINNKDNENDIISQNKDLTENHYEINSPNKTLTENHYGVSSSNKIATDVGMEVLEKGGNAVDAAVAISYVLNVVEPFASGIGGGGSMLIHSPEENKSDFFDYREIAPISTSKKINNTGIPGFVRGMEEVHSAYGSMEMNELLEPAIQYANNGFDMTQYLYNRFETSGSKLNKQQLPQFYTNGKTNSIGSKIIQKDLAKTLTNIRQNGAETFYNGSIAKELMSVNGWKKEDLITYSVNKRKPIQTSFEGYELLTAPAPFGGATLAQILKLSEYMDIEDYKLDKLNYIRKMSKIATLAYNDRANNVGDPNFINKDYESFVKDEYIESLLNINDLSINDEEEHESTTHFVVIDKDGMVVSCTNTLSSFFGNGEYIKGFFLNDTLTSFNYTNENSINRYEPGKRPRTFMAPTVIKKGNDFIMGIGSPGGNRIPQTLAQTILGNLKFEHSLKESIEDTRFSFTNVYNIVTEKNLPLKQRKILTNEGYKIHVNDSKLYHGSIQAIVYDKEKGMYGGADFRRQGTWRVK